MTDLFEKIAELTRFRKETEGIEQRLSGTEEGKMLLMVTEILEQLGELLAQGISDEWLNWNADSIEGTHLEGDSGFYLCPNCGENINIFDADIESEKHIICPRCNEPIMIARNF